MSIWASWCFSVSLSVSPSLCLSVVLSLSFLSLSLGLPVFFFQEIAAPASLGDVGRASGLLYSPQTLPPPILAVLD